MKTLREMMDLIESAQTVAEATGDEKFDTMLSKITAPKAVKAQGKEDKINELVRQYFWHKRRADLGAEKTDELGHDKQANRVLQQLAKMGIDLSTFDPVKLRNIKSQVYEQDSSEEQLEETTYANAEVIKSKSGKPIGEIYVDANGWGFYHYAKDDGGDHLDNRDQALQELKDLHYGHEVDEEQLEETTDEAVAKVEQLFRDKR